MTITCHSIFSSDDFTVHTSPFGVCRVYFPGSTVPQLPMDHDLVLAKLAEAEIARYLAGKLLAFTVPVDLRFATAFQKVVYNALMEVAIGQTVTYGELAVLSGNPKAFRAVGTVLGKNPIPLIIPCHRVLAANGPGGWSGPKGWKERLLKIESDLVK